jgi:hypothetical protein
VRWTAHVARIEGLGDVPAAWVEIPERRNNLQDETYMEKENSKIDHEALLRKGAECIHLMRIETNAGSLCT